MPQSQTAFVADGGPRRLLIATAVARYQKEPAWDRPGLVEARQEVIDLFCGSLGYEHVGVLGLNPTAHQLTDALRAFCTSPERRPDDLIVAYIAGHGEVLDENDGGGHVLLTHETDPDDIADALPTETLARKMLGGTGVRRLLLMLDTCYSGQGGNELAAAALARMSRRWAASPGSGLVIVSSAQPLEQAGTGVFPRLLRDAVQSEATAGHRPETLALEAVVQRMNVEPGHQRVTLTQVGLTGQVPPFLLNPRHDPRLNNVDLAIQQDAVWQAQADRRYTELNDRLIVRAKGSQGPDGSGWWFAGRDTALADISSWLVETRGDLGSDAALAVTAWPGSGKTAVLGIVAALAHRELRHSVPVHALGLAALTVEAARRVDVAVYAQNLTDRQVLAALTAAARTSASTPGELLDSLTGRARPLTVLIDGLDEAATPDSLCSTVLRPLIGHAAGRIRLLLGTRPHLLDRLGLDSDRQIDLDTERYADRPAMVTYTIRNLLQAHRASPYLTCPPDLRNRIAAEVVAAAGPSFLVARLAAGTLAAASDIPDPDDARWRAGLPRHADQAMADDLATRLGADATRAIDLLRPLAYAQGQGFPWEDLWAAIASAISGRPYTDADIAWLRDKAGSYIIEAVETDRSAYRLYHQALAEHLRVDADDVAVHAAIARALIDRVPIAADGTRDWARAHPYTLNHLASHGALGQVLDDVLTDAEYLVHADPDSLTVQLHAARTERARLAAAIYRTSIGIHRPGTSERRRRILALDAARYNDTQFLRAFNQPARTGLWTPRHATGSTLHPGLQNVLATWVRFVTCTVLNGRPVAVTGSSNNTIQVWDLLAGRALDLPFTGHTDRISAAACTVLDGRSVAVTGSEDRTVRVWDLATGQPLGRPLTGHTNTVSAVACTVLDGRPVAVTSGDRTVRVWDLATRQPIGPPLSHADGVEVMACTMLEGRPIVITGSFKGTFSVWDLITRQTIGKRPAESDKAFQSAVACAELDGRPVVLSDSIAEVQVWDPATCLRVGQPLTGHRYKVMAIACTTLDGRPVVVTGSNDKTVRVWDLATRQPIGEPLAGHTAQVCAVACAVLDGRPVAVTGSDDSTVRVWELTGARPVGQRLIGHTESVWGVNCAVLAGRPVAVTHSSDRTIRVWDVATGHPIGKPIAGPTDVVSSVVAACTVLDGRPIAVAVSGGRIWLWDLTTGQPIGKKPTAGRYSYTSFAAVACTTLGGRPVAVSVSEEVMRIWDLSTCTSQLVGRRQTRYSSAVRFRAVACTELDGRPVAVTGCDDRTVRIWDLATRKLLGQPLTGHANSVRTVACTELDGRPVAVTGSDDSTIRIWDLAAGRPLGEPLTGHTRSVRDVTCTTLDGRPVAVTASFDDTVRVWDLITHTPLDTLDLPGCHAIAVSSSQRLICAFGSDIAIYTRHL